MKSLNKQWRFLIIVLVLSLIAAIGWEVYSISSDARSEFRPVESPLLNSKLLSDPVLDHLSN